MSSDQPPIIQFSPFQALLIGEKNKILKRQPMKNTIFVTRLKQPTKNFNLKDLFGLTKDAKPQKDVVFKMPQRVRDFLKTRRLKIMRTRNQNEKKQDEVCYEFEGRKLNVKNERKRKKSRKFKKKCKFKDGLLGRVAKKFASRPGDCLGYERETRKKGERLKGKDGKFVKQKYLSNCVPQHHKKKKTLRRRTRKDCLNCQFKFPKCPALAESSNFEDCPGLIDLIYENFPKFKFSCSDTPRDFSETLENSDIFQPIVKIYKNKRNEYDGSKVRVLLNSSFSYVNLSKVDLESNKNKFIKNCYNSIDEPYQVGNQLICGKAIGNLFFPEIRREKYLHKEFSQTFFRKFLVR